MRRPVGLLVAGILAVGAQACSDPAAQPVGSATLTTDPPTAQPVGPATITIDVATAERPFDRRLLGTNAPAWLGPERLGDPAFRNAVIALGASVIRMPGGSWSNGYDWLGCEQRDTVTCFWPWAARPSDYAAFLASTGLPGMWTVSINGTAEEAAALVAFFNGSIDDDRPIGVDRRGRSWGTVAEWAALRSAGGQRDPVGIELWEVGNEVYAARGSTGPECASFGWEDVWTCDGDEYMNGDGEHDGFLRFREAMLDVDPTISVGAVGIGGSQGEWGSFGQEVIDAAEGRIDFYVVHHYGFDRGEPPTAEVLAEPERAWPGIVEGVTAGFDDARATPVPIAVTEYNLFSFQEGDSGGLMAEPVNALYVALAIGAMADQGVAIANQWDLVNGRTEAGSDYGIFDADDGSANPQFYALALWSRMRETLVAVDVAPDAADVLDVHASVDGSGGLTVLVVNRSPRTVDASIEIDALADGAELAVTTAATDMASPEARWMLVDGTRGAWPIDDGIVGRPGSVTAPVSSGRTTYSFEPLSITVLSADDSGDG